MNITHFVSCISFVCLVSAQQEVPGGGARSESDITLSRAIAIEKQAHSAFGFPSINSSTIRWRLEGRVQSVLGRSYSLNTPEFCYTIDSGRGLIRTFMNKKRMQERDKRKNRTSNHLFENENQGRTYALDILRKIGAPQPLTVEKSGLSTDHYKTSKTDHDRLAQYHIFVKNAAHGYVADLLLDAQDGAVLYYTEAAKRENGWNRR